MLAYSCQYMLLSITLEGFFKVQPVCVCVCVCVRVRVRVWVRACVWDHLYEAVSATAADSGQQLQSDFHYVLSKKFVALQVIT